MRASGENSLACLQEFRWRQRLWSESRLVYGALEEEHLVDPHADGRVSGTVRRELDLRRAFLYAIHVVAKLLAVINAGHVVPHAKRMQRLPVHQRATCFAGLIEAVQIPLTVNDADLEQHTIFSVGAGGGVALAQMKPALLEWAAVRPENGFVGERPGSRERVIVDEQRIVDAIEQNGLSQG